MHGPTSAVSLCRAGEILSQGLRPSVFDAGNLAIRTPDPSYDRAASRHSLDLEKNHRNAN